MHSLFSGEVERTASSYSFVDACGEQVGRQYTCVV